MKQKALIFEDEYINKNVFKKNKKPISIGKIKVKIIV